VWAVVAAEFNNASECPRSESELTKKWDNMVQRHRALYNTHQEGIKGTGKKKIKYVTQMNNLTTS